jgi:formate dehydrogenase major subunit
VDSKKGKPTLGIRDLIPAWSVVRQLGGKDRFALGKAAQFSCPANLEPRTTQADEVVRSKCPSCAVGCG